MASYLLPSFMAAWDFSSVSPFSLSANLQKRILSHLLKRTLGHLVDGGQLDLAQIDAGIGSGRIEIRNVQLDADAINRRLPSLPIALTSGQIGNILIQLPVPSFWSGKLSISISDISVHLQPSPRDAIQDFTATQDLAASFASAASQLFVEDEEASEIEQSIHESLSPEDERRVQQNSNEESGSLIASYVEALLARLKVTIENVHVCLHSDTADLSFKLQSATVQSSNTRTKEQDPQSGSSAPHQCLVSETARTIELQGCEVWLHDRRKPKDSPGSYSSSSSEASSDGFSVGQPDQEPKDMDQSVASLQESSASLYESAIGDAAFHEATDDRMDAAKPHREEPTQRTIPADSPHLLLSLGQDPVVVTLKTVKERREEPVVGSASRRPLQRLVSITTDVDIQIGNAGAIAYIDHASLLMTIARRLTRGSSQRSSSQSEPVVKEGRARVTLSSVRRQLKLHGQINSLNVIVGYDAPAAVDRIQASIDAFWLRPSRSHPDFGHLRLRCDKISASYLKDVVGTTRDRAQPDIQLCIEDMGLFEHLPLDLYEQCSQDASRILPILILDSNLPKSSNSDAAAAKHHRHDYARSTVDVFDWRYNVSHSGPRPVGSSTDSESSPRAARFKSSEMRSTSSSTGISPYFRTAYGDRGWKVKTRTRSQSVSQSPALESASPNITVSIYSSASSGGQGQIEAHLAPIHCFIDVSLVTRLMPALRKFAASQISDLQDERGDDRILTDSIATLASSVLTVQSTHGMLNDLDDDQNGTKRKSTYILHLTIAFLRVEVRTPRVSYDTAALAGRSLSTARSSGLDRRSGILVLQVQGLVVRSGLAEQETSGGVRFAQPGPAANRRHDSSTIVTARISAETVSAFLALPTDSRALVLALIETADNVHRTRGTFPSAPPKVLPQVELSRCEDAAADRGGRVPRGDQMKDRCSATIPSIKLELGKDQLDSLQYMADDLTQSINLWSSDDLCDSGTLDSEGLKILGSRFFGSRAGMSMMSSSTDSTATATARHSPRSSSFSITISEASIRLWLPAPEGNQTSEDRPKSLLLMSSDFELLFDSDKTRNINRIEIRVPQMQLSIETKDAAEDTSSSLLAFRTMESSLDGRRRNMVLLILEAYAEPGTSYREQNVDLTLCCVTLSPSFDQELIPRVKRLLKSPAGVFENVEPNEVTRISFKAKDCSIHVAPPNTNHRVAVAVGEASVKTKLTTHAPKTAVKLAVGNLDLFAIEAEASPSTASLSMAKSACEHWAGRGYARVIHVPESKGSLNLNSLTRPEVDVRITKLRVKLQAAADTLEIVIGLVTAVTESQAAASDKAVTDPREAKHITLHRESPDRTAAQQSTGNPDPFDKMAELMSDIEDDAYRLAAPLPEAADLIDDDVPTDAAFLGARGRYHPEIVETTLDSDEFFGGESVASISLLAPRTDTIIFADEDVTIRILDSKGICPVREYFTDPDLRPSVDSALGPAASSVRVRITNFDLSVRLHSGYDWATTRKAVDREAKLVRKRLQKIKQLLAEGQVPDDSVEAATSNLLDSIHMSLPNDPSELAPDDMLQAMDDELGDHSDTTSEADSEVWQALPNVRGAQSSTRSSNTAPNPNNAKLQRSARSQIDFNFRGLEVEFDSADPSQPSHILSRIAVNARRFEIIDNIKTSTWRTFLTEMQDRNAALRHDAESKMVKVEILNVRPAAGALSDDAAASETPEVRMRAKISPLRLHVDQDALDFLKKFFMFKPPGRPEPAPPQEPPGPVLPFVQFAEVLPIKIKLDYKPKRVDYNLLRQGKTIELMNFFHFEGSEMVLRHVTLRGINGWARLFDTLNDIWTPDVKANQLADFLSGLGPIRSLVNVGAGLADLVLLPIEQYHKDGRVLRGVSRGAKSFAKSTALEAVKLGARLATGTQVILEQAEAVLGGEMRENVTARAVGPEGKGESWESLSESRLGESAFWGQDSAVGVGASEVEGKERVSKYASQPVDMGDALNQAYEGLAEGFTSAAQTILAIPMEVYEPESSVGGSGQGRGAAGASGRPVVKAVPIAILRGARGATQAIAKTMQGVQVAMGDRENLKEGKYKQPSTGASGSGSGSARKR